jgi:formimidoylglutamate deiminase
MANLHSHAHQRGLVGLADQLAAGAPSTLWSWREVMYRHVLALDPDDLEAYAKLAYIEMLRRGYTAVGEFHYVHHDPSGARYARLSEMSERIVAAASRAGTALTLLPVLYTSGGIGRPPDTEQRRFVTDLDEYLRLIAEVEPLVAVGIAPHSLRAVKHHELTSLLEARAAGPVHIHVAERTEEVAEVEAALGLRPVAWLLQNAELDERWCAIHATHMTEDERAGLAATRAVAGLCPLTEANLGDGRFPLASYRHEGGRFGIGTDANHMIDLPGELRMLEYGQRLYSQRRDTLLLEGERSVAEVLFRLSCAGGAQALEQPMGGIRAGLRCDLVELDPNHPSLLGQSPETVLDAWIFSSTSESVVRTVLVGGRMVVADSRHPEEEPARREVDAVMRRLHTAWRFGD